MPASGSRLASLRTAFFSGLVVVAPLAATWIVFLWLVSNVGGGFRPVFRRFVPGDLFQATPDVIWDIISTLIVIVLITLLGYASRYVFGKYFGGVTEKIVQGIPGVGTLYNSIKQIVNTVSTQNRSLFSKVVLVEFPRKGVYTIGFLTGVTHGEAQAKTTPSIVSVFVPTTPNPTGGYLLLVSKEELIELEMSVGDGMKMIISGGSVVPPWPAPAPAVR